MGATCDITIIRGEPFSSLVETNIVGSGDFDLSNYLVSGGIRFRYSEENLAEFNVNVLTPASSGLATISLTANQTRGIPVSQCIYYLKAIPSGQVDPTIDLLNGYANVYPL